jgi:hypothetical protein
MSNRPYPNQHQRKVHITEEVPTSDTPDPHPTEYDYHSDFDLMDIAKGELPAADPRQLLTANKTAQQKPKPKPRKVNQTDVTHQPLSFEPVDIEGQLYYRVNITFFVSQYTLLKAIGALLDRGANGGLLGNDVWVFAWHEKTVDVKGLSNHTESNLRLASAAAKIDTPDGPHIIIMHQYAYLGQGTTIHSAGQIEHHGHNICDKSKKVGGQQRLLTVDGITIPLAIRNGLPYMDMKPCTPEEFEQLPHIVLTSDAEWDPTVLDFEYDSSNNYSTDFAPTSTILDPRIDHEGNMIHTTEITSNDDLPTLEHCRHDYDSDEDDIAPDDEDAASCPPLVPRDFEPDEDDSIEDEPLMDRGANTGFFAFEAHLQQALEHEFHQLIDDFTIIMQDPFHYIDHHGMIIRRAQVVNLPHKD